jgi:ribonucleotide reductase alpha subunit
LVRELLELGLWNEQLKDDIIQHKGSIQALKLPDHIKQKYKIVWEIPMKHLINMARDRSPYICQSQSLNLWIESPTIPILTSMHFYAWEQGLKTGIYYLRRKPKHQVQQFTIAPTETCETCSA